MKDLFIPEELENLLIEKKFNISRVCLENNITDEFLGCGILWQQVTDFFRDKGFHVFADPNHSGWYWVIEKTNGTSVKCQPVIELCYNSHKEALNKGIEKALELI